MRAVIQAENDLRVKTDLQLDTFFRGQQELPFAAFRQKGNAVIGQGAEFAVLADERIRLESAGIGEDGFLPARKPVQPAQGFDRGGAGFLHQVEGVHHQRLYAACSCGSRINRTHLPKRRVRQVLRQMESTAF